jgi:hypothetical protein
MAILAWWSLEGSGSCQHLTPTSARRCLRSDDDDHGESRSRSLLSGRAGSGREAADRCTCHLRSSAGADDTDVQVGVRERRRTGKYCADRVSSTETSTERCIYIIVYAATGTPTWTLTWFYCWTDQCVSCLERGVWIRSNSYVHWTKEVLIFFPCRTKKHTRYLFFRTGRTNAQQITQPTTETADGRPNQNGPNHGNTSPFIIRYR